ncbi:MAG: XisI protein-like protein, partial [Chthonomonadales bacterium]|nr:XisI protein-like protein [Chthonomonadales bacterium]
DKLTLYRSLIKQALTERADLMRSQPLPGEEVICLLDEVTDNYLLLRTGWLQGKRLYSITLHLRLVKDKIHLEQDWTDDFLADLVSAGIPRTDFVMAFTPPEMRPVTEFVAA